MLTETCVKKNTPDTNIVFIRDFSDDVAKVFPSLNNLNANDFQFHACPTDLFHSHNAFVRVY